MLEVKELEKGVYVLESQDLEVATVIKEEEGRVSGLRWFGELSYSGLETEAVSVLSETVSKGRRKVLLDNPADRRFVSVVLMGKERDFSTLEDSSNKSLSRARDFQQYRRWLSTPNKVEWARFDVKAPELEYKFVADNLNLPDATCMELLLPMNYQWSKELAEWVIRHHFGGDQLANKVSAADIVTIMNEIIP